MRFDDEIPVDPMESGQRDTCLTLEVHRPSNGVFQRLPRSLVVERPSHPKLQIIPGIFLGGLDSIQIVKNRRTQDQARRHDGHKWRIERLNCNGTCLGVGMATARAQPTQFAKIAESRAALPIPRGVLEGLNNKAKVTVSKSDGFRTCRVRTGPPSLTWRLPEPESAHDFF